MLFPPRGNLFRVIYLGYISLEGEGRRAESSVTFRREDDLLRGGFSRGSILCNFFQKDGETLSRAIAYHIFFC